MCSLEKKVDQNTNASLCKCPGGDMSVLVRFTAETLMSWCAEQFDDQPEFCLHLKLHVPLMPDSSMPSFASFILVLSSWVRGFASKGVIECMSSCFSKCKQDACISLHALFFL